MPSDVLKLVTRAKEILVPYSTLLLKQVIHLMYTLNNTRSEYCLEEPSLQRVQIEEGRHTAGGERWLSGH